MRCSFCGSDTRPGLQFCTACGRPVSAAPTPGRSDSRRRLWPILGVVALLVVSVGTTILLVRAPAAADSQPPAPTTVAAPTTTTGALRSSPDLVAEPSTTGEGPADIVARERSTVSGLDGWWVPQISSKKVGMSADGIVYDEDAIVANYETWRSRYPQAVLLRSDDFATFTSPGFYVTAVAEPFSTAGAANSWCASAGLPRDDCFAKLLSTTPVSGGTVVHR
jgi:hypothetical protein